MIAPTIGRRVWYLPTEHDRKSGMAINSGTPQPCDAGIAYVWGDRMVNLTVADHSGQMHSRTSVKLLQDEDTVPEGMSYAQWMPYQTGQAKVAA